MKIRTPLGAVRLLYLFIFFAAGMLALLPLRQYQILFLIENGPNGTGFYKLGYQNHFTVILSVCILAFMCLCFILVPAIQRKKLSDSPLVGRHPWLAGISFVACASFFYDAVQQSRLFIGSGVLRGLFKGGAAYPDLQGRDDYFSKVFGDSLCGVRAIFALLALIYFLLFALHYLGNSRIKLENNSLLALCPIIWAGSRMLNRFLMPMNLKNISDVVFELFMLSALMLFFLSFAKLNSHILSGGVMRKVYTYGFIAVTFGLICCVPRFLLLVTGSGSKLIPAFPVEWTDLALALMILTYLMCLSLIRGGDPASVLLKEPDESGDDDDLEDVRSEGDDVFYERYIGDDEQPEPDGNPDEKSGGDGYDEDEDDE